MKLQIIQLEAHDDVASVRDRLSFVKAERVLLIWPDPRMVLRPVLSRKLDLVLIQREAARRGTWLALVTRDPDVIEAARDLNISTFPSTRASQRGHWRRPRNKVFVDRADRPVDAPDPYQLMLHASRLKVLSPAQRRIRQLSRIVAFIAMIAALVSVTYLVVPGATVRIAPAQDQIQKTVTLVIDPAVTSIRVERGRIPGTLMTIDVESQATVPTTGQIDVPSTLASGTVTFNNRIESDVLVPAGTIVSTPGRNPVRFRTVSDVTVPAGVGKTVDVTIQATDDSAGTRGNIEPNLIINIEGDLSRLLSVRNAEETRGGIVREQKIVTQSDYDALLLLARKQIRQDAQIGFSERLSGSQFPAPGSIKIINEGSEELTYSHFIGDPTETLGVTIRARVQALIVDEKSAQQAALARLTAEIPPGRRLLLDTVRYERGPIQQTDDQGLALYVISASGSVLAEIDVEKARQRIAGLGLDEARELLNRDWLLDPRRPPEITLTPGFFWQLPVLPARISIEIAR